jgi:DnaJ-class molecular chaperone
MPAPTGRRRPDAEARAVLGVASTATAAEITTAYRALVRRLHPDRGHRSADDQRRLADVIAAYRVLRQQPAYDQDADQTASPGTPIAVRRSPERRDETQPDLRVGPVRQHR